MQVSAQTTITETDLEDLLSQMETATDKEARRLFFIIYRACKGKPELLPVLWAASWNTLTRRGINLNEA